MIRIFAAITFVLTSIFTAFSQDPTLGLIFKNDDKVTDGYVLFGNNKTTYLIDNCGLIVNQWESEYHEPGVSKYLLPNGDLIRAGSIDGQFNVGGLGGIFEIYSWSGELKWSYQVVSDSLHAHHDLAPLPNGNFIITVFERHTEEEASTVGRKYDGEFWTERLQEIKILPDNQAEIVWEWSLWDHLVQDQNELLPNYGVISENPYQLDVNYIDEGEKSSGNWIHANGIDYNPQLDQIAISSRLMSEIWIIDHNSTTEQAKGDKGDFLYRFGNPATYQRGTEDDRILRNQHDIRWVPEGYPLSGSLMVFNNNHSEGRSKVLIWEPPLNDNGTYALVENEVFGPSEFLWTYEAEGFFSSIVSGAQVLPNGNVLICEGIPGHFFEVTQEKEIVWSYINPGVRGMGIMAQGTIPENNTTFRATRYLPSYPAFENLELKGTEPVELEPFVSACYNPKDSTEEVLSMSDSPASFDIIIDNKIVKINSLEPYQVMVYDLNGHVLVNEYYQKNSSINFETLNRLVIIKVQSNTHTITKKLLFR
jgi:hypothetical protein